MSNLNLEQQEKILLCQSVRVMAKPVAQSQAGVCSKCDIRVWLAPSSVNLMQQVSGIKVLCEVCADVLRGYGNEVDETAFDDVDATSLADAAAQGLTVDSPAYETVGEDMVDVATGEVVETSGDTKDINVSKLLSDINALLRVKCGDGETIDDNQVKKVLKGRELLLMPGDALEKLLADLRAM